MGKDSLHVQHVKGKALLIVLAAKELERFLANSCLTNRVKIVTGREDITALHVMELEQ